MQAICAEGWLHMKSRRKIALGSSTITRKSRTLEKIWFRYSGVTMWSHRRSHDTQTTWCIYIFRIICIWGSYWIAHLIQIFLQAVYLMLNIFDSLNIRNGFSSKSTIRFLTDPRGSAESLVPPFVMCYQVLCEIFSLRIQKVLAAWFLQVLIHWCLRCERGATLQKCGWWIIGILIELTDKRAVMVIRRIQRGSW